MNRTMFVPCFLCYLFFFFPQMHKKAKRHTRKRKASSAKKSAKHRSPHARVNADGVVSDKFVMHVRGNKKRMFPSLRPRHRKVPLVGTEREIARRMAHRLNSSIKKYNKYVGDIGRKQASAVGVIHKVHRTLDKKAAKKYKPALVSMTSTVVRDIADAKNKELASIEQEVKRQVAIIKKFNARR